MAPTTLFTAWYGATALLWQGTWVGLGLGLLALLYPPAVPYLRLRGRELWRRLGTDRTPLYDGLARLRHLETHDDHLKVGRLARQLGETDLAVEHLGRAHDLDPSHLSGRYHYALALADTGRDEPAAELLASVVEADERHAFGDALFHLGRVRLRLGQRDAALTALDRHHELFPGHRQAALLRARALAATGDLEAAQAALAVARRPAGDGEHLLPEEALARARARVTILRRGGGGDA